MSTAAPTRPAADASAAPTRRAAPEGRRRTPGAPSTGPLLVVTEVAVTAVTAAAVVGLSRLFVDGTFLVPVLGMAVAGHVVAIACRRRELSAAVSFAVSCAALVIAVSAGLLWDTTILGVPTPATLDTALAQLSSALATFREVVAPAPVEPGFVLAAGIGVWVAAFTADTAAFRAGAPVEAVVPASTLFLFAAALGAPGSRVSSTTVFLLALLVYWLAQRALRQASSPTLVTGEGGGGPGAVLGVGVVLAVVAVAAAAVVGPRLPGAGEGALVPWRASDRAGSSARVTVSPLVDVRTRLVEQSDAVVFRVRSSERSYWRLTSLERFDGRLWSTRGNYRDTGRVLDPADPSRLATTRRVRQEFEIDHLASTWLPAAYEPVAIEIEGTDALYDERSGSLVTDEEAVPQGQRYVVESDLKTLEAAELAAVDSPSPAAIRDTYTELPDGFSIPVQELAHEIAGAPDLGPFEQARALQDSFRDGSFTYDLEVGAGHDTSSLEEFLFETRRGYCEQFAGAFAAMARAVGLPARVAVGFTPGEVDQEGTYTVRGLNGHAWPEVYLNGYGWVPFEPTPNRGIPGGEAYTDVPEQQAPPGSEETATTLPPTSTTAPLPAGASPSTTLPDLFAAEGGGRGDVATESLLGRWTRRALTGGAVVVGVPLAWIGALALARSVRRRRRRTAAGSPAERIRLAWAEAAEALLLARHRQRPSETAREFVDRLDTLGSEERTALRALAELVTAADFAGGPLPTDLAGHAEELAASIERGMQEAADLRRRLLHAIDPRPLVPGRASRWQVGDAPVPATPVAGAFLGDAPPVVGTAGRSGATPLS